MTTEQHLAMNIGNLFIQAAALSAKADELVTQAEQGKAAEESLRLQVAEAQKETRLTSERLESVNRLLADKDRTVETNLVSRAEGERDGLLLEVRHLNGIVQSLKGDVLNVQREAGMAKLEARRLREKLKRGKRGGTKR